MLGNAYMEAGKPCEAKDTFSSCIEADDNFPQCRNNIIVAEKKCKLQDKALDDVKARAAGAKTPEGEYSVAIQAREKGLVNDEERAYKRCLKYDPQVRPVPLRAVRALQEPQRREERHGRL